MKRSALNPGEKRLLRRTPMQPRKKSLARRTRLKPKAISPASAAQRSKVKGAPCVHCNEPACDPMHLCPRALGGCDDPLCVLPGCRKCHRAFDEGKLDLLADLVGRFKAEIAHAQMHMDPVSLLERLSSCEVVLKERRP
jgi:hypothetical protein